MRPPHTTAVAPASITLGATLHGRYLRRTVMLWIFHLLQTVGYYGFGSIAPLVLLAEGFSIADSLGYVALTFLGYPAGAALAIPLIEHCECRTSKYVCSCRRVGLAGRRTAGEPRGAVAGTRRGGAGARRRTTRSS